MAWELHVSCGDEKRSGPPFLGDLDEVRATIESFFPDVYWQNKARGICDCEQGSIEFDISGNPAETVSLRVHSADPSPSLIAMGRAKNWVVTNDSTGNTVESETQFDIDSLNRLISQADAVRSKANSQSVTLKHTLPRIKLRLPLIDVKHSAALRHLVMIELHSNEVTLDIFEEYSEAAWKNDEIRRFTCPFVFNTDEVHLPNGARFAAAFFNCRVPEVNTYFDQYWKRDARRSAKYHDGQVVLYDGTTYDAKECFWVERTTGKSRRP